MASRYEEMFSSPERVANYFAMQCFGSNGDMCYYCPFADCDETLHYIGSYQSVYETLLEWLRGDAE